MSMELGIQWLTDSLVSVTILFAIVLVLRRPVARMFGPEVAYLLWLLPLARMFMPAITRTIEVPVSTDASSIMEMPVAWTRAPDFDAAAHNAAAVAEHSVDWVWVGLLLWLGGAALFLIVQLATYLQARDELLADSRKIDRIDGVDLIEVPNVAGPFAFGLFKRYIVLPVGFGLRFNAAERRLAIAHELAHHRGFDLWANAAAMGMLALYWFNPLAWAAWRAFRFDQEAACDARVVRDRSADERAVYGLTIAKAAAGPSVGRSLAYASPLTPGDKIKERLRMLKQKDSSPVARWTGRGLVVAGTASALAMTATVTYAVVPVPEAPEVPEAPDGVATAPLAPEAPLPPVAPVREGDDYVYRVKRADGVVVLRVDAPLSRAELAERVSRAEASHREADAALASADAALAEADAAIAGADAALAGAEKARRDVERVGKVKPVVAARRGVLAMSGPGGAASMTHDPERNLMTLSVSGGPKTTIRTLECDEDSARSDPFMIQEEKRNGKTVTTKIVTCGDVMPDQLAILDSVEKGLNVALAQIEVDLKHAMSDEERAEMREEIRADLEEAREEIRRERDEARREIQRERERRRNGR